MMLTIAEVEWDLANTRKDFDRLTAIVDNLKLFINEAGDEDRSFLKKDLLKFQGLQVVAEGLIPRIERLLESLKR